MMTSTEDYIQVTEELEAKIDRLNNYKEIENSLTQARAIAELKKQLVERNKQIETCEECDEPGLKEEMIEVELYDSPYDVNGRIAYFHREIPEKFADDSMFKYYESCFDLLTDTGWADFRYFYCEDCQRYVCRQSPSNGWHGQVRIINDCEEICLKCYREMILEEGVDREQIEAGQFPGLFHPNAEEAGYECIDENIYISTQVHIDRARERILKLMDEGYKIVIGYKSMAIGGLEGTISIHIKKEV